MVRLGQFVLIPVAAGPGFVEVRGIKIDKNVCYGRRDIVLQENKGISCSKAGVVYGVLPGPGDYVGAFVHDYASWRWPFVSPYSASA